MCKRIKSEEWRRGEGGREWGAGGRGDACAKGEVGRRAGAEKEGANRVRGFRGGGGHPPRPAIVVVRDDIKDGTDSEGAVVVVVIVSLP